VAESLKAGAYRQRDFVARYGGEEFVVVLPETDAVGAEMVAMRCRDALAKTDLPHETSSVAPTVTISMGVGTIVPTGDTDSIAFIVSVDRRLYRAKEIGRNAVVAEEQK